MTDEKDAALALVKSSLARTRVAQIVLALFVVGLGYLISLAPDETSGLGMKIAAFGMAGFFGVIAAVLFYVALVKNSPSRSALVIALRDRPDDVVWLYQQDIEVSVNGIPGPVRDCNVIAKLADGSTVAMTVAKGRADALLDALARLAPAAAKGFSEEREAEFKRDPRAVAHRA